MKFEQLGIAARLGASFGTVLVLMAAIALGGTSLQNTSREELAATLTTAGAKEALAADMKALVLEQSATMRNIGLDGELAQMNHDRDRTMELRKRYRELFGRMRALQLSDAERDIVGRLEKGDADLDGPLKEAVAIASVMRSEDAAKVILQDIDPVVQRTIRDLDELATLEHRSDADAMAAARVHGDRLVWAIDVVTGAALLAAGLLAWLVTRSILRQLGGEPAYAKEIVSRIAGGDLAVQVRLAPRDRDSMLFAMHTMAQNLRQLAGEVATGARAVSDASAQIAQGNLDLSQRTEEQASTLEETASSMEELTSVVNQNAEHARRANELAAGASRVAARGGEAVGEVVRTMGGISQASRRIADIIGVIDGIAFQTNILALNAAVEAARAGEQGRGFSVVAAEVRALAQRSADAAREIKDLIGDSVGKVQAGTGQVEAAGATMQEVVASVQKVSELIAEIAAASGEQSRGIAQVTGAVGQMEQVVQQNATLVEQGAAATTSMKELAADLLRSVARLHLGASSTPAPVQAPPARGVHAVAPSPVRPVRPSEPAARPPRAAATRPAVPELAGGAGWKEF